MELNPSDSQGRSISKSVNGRPLMLAVVRPLADTLTATNLNPLYPSTVSRRGVTHRKQRP